MTSELERTAGFLMRAGTYLDVFGRCDGDEQSQYSCVKTGFRQLARAVHPDRFSNIDDQAMATAAFVRLQELEKQANDAIKRGRYGFSPRVQIVSKRLTHSAGAVFKRGDIADLYEADSSQPGGVTEQTLLKIARSPRDNDLLVAEVQALTQLRAKGSDEKLHPFVPELLDSFKYAKGKQRLQANAIKRLDGFYNLKEVVQAFPSGVHSLDMVWMWRRLLVALGFAHEQGVIHGAVLPEHVMIHPELHGLVLIDWCYSTCLVGNGSVSPIKAISKQYSDWYPKEVMTRQPPSFGTDIALAARTMVYLLGGNPTKLELHTSVPRPLRAFLRGCGLDNQHARPQDAWALLKEFDELLESIGRPYYPRRFRPFAMPTGMA